MTSLNFEYMLTTIIQAQKDRVQHQLETLFTIVTSTGKSIGDGETTTPLFRWMCDYNEYQQQLVRILNHKMLSFQNAKDEMFKAGGQAALTALLSPENLEFVCDLEGSVALQMNLDIRNKSGNSPLGFACENGQTEVVQLMIPFLGDKGLDHKNKDGNTPRDIARIHGHREIDYILTDELIQRGMEQQGHFPLIDDIDRATEPIIQPWE